jgi:hypothetical protein
VPRPRSNVSTLQKQHAKLFDGLVRHRRAQITDEFVPSIENGAIADLLAREPRACRTDRLQKADGFRFDVRNLQYCSERAASTAPKLSNWRRRIAIFR